MGERLVVQFARGSNRPREGGFDQPRMAPRPRRTVHRMTITGLPFETSWQVSNTPSLVHWFAYLLHHWLSVSGVWSGSIL